MNELFIKEFVVLMDNTVILQYNLQGHSHIMSIWGLVFHKDNHDI
jgi:hypothetical protein